MRTTPTRIEQFQQDPSRQQDLPESLHPVLRRVYANRNLATPDELQLDLANLLPVDALGGTDVAAELLHAVLERRGRILVLGDFDADGATSCALAIRGLKAMGAVDIDYLVPNRFAFGYGMTPEIVPLALAKQPDLILTVDNGISSLQGVALAREAGVEVVVTDHHLAGETLPGASAIINPNLPGDPFPSKALAGVGVVFYLLAALRARLRHSGWFRRRGLAEVNLADFLDLVALGTVADLVPLDHNNRILVHQGLRRMRAGACCPGIAALSEVAGRNQTRLVASDLGFAIAPRLNAAGRLEDMSLGIETLLTDEREPALDLARQLDTLNHQRRSIEQQMQQQAQQLLEDLPEDAPQTFGLCLFRREWHQGVIGILAARIRERYHRPAIAFAPGEEKGVIKGSARSIPGLHMRDTLAAVAARYPDLLRRFGGHAMAAGLSLQRADFDRFRLAFDQEVRQRVDSAALSGVIHSDGALQPEELTMDLARLLRHAGPWGQGFPEPLFDSGFRILQQRVLGEKHLKWVLQPVDGDQTVDAIAFNQAERQPRSGQGRIHAAYRLDVNEFRGRQSLQLIVEHFEETNG